MGKMADPDTANTSLNYNVLIFNMTSFGDTHDRVRVVVEWISRSGDT